MLRVSSALVTLALLTACRNSPPTSPEVAIEPAAPTTVDALVASITLDAVDDDKKDEVAYSWAWTQNGTARPELTADTVPASETARGDTWTVTLSATDGEAEVSAESSVTVGNTAPVLDAVELDSASPGAVDDIVVTAVGSDVDGDSLTYTYSWTVDGDASDITAPRVPASDTLPEQTWVVTVTAADDELESEPLTATAVVGNSVPEVAVVSLKPAEPSRLSTLTADVSASDPDGSDVTVTYSWLVGGTEVGTEASLSASGLAVGDAVSLTVTASDGIDSSTATSAGSAVIVDLPPEVTGVSLSPSTPTKAGPVTASVTSNDPESDPLTFTYRWFVAGSEVLVGSSDTLSSDLFGKGDGIRVEVVANDGYLDGSLVSSGVYTVGNTAPTVSSATIEGEITKTSGATCTGVGFADIDGDPEGYEVRWLVNGSEVSVASTLSGNLYSIGDSIQCVLAPFDGDDKGTSVSSNTVTVVNALPKVASVALSSTSPREGDVLTVTVGALSDADGDSVTVSYEWKVNGSTVATSPTLASDAFNKGDSVTVTVTPNDGIDDGAPVTSAEATVLNTVPTTPVVVVAPDYPNESQDLQCVVQDPSTDADGDTVAYAVAWTVDGSPWSGSVTETVLAGDTVPAGSLVEGQVWSCALTPSDDEDDGSTGTSDDATIFPPSNGASQAAAGESCASIIDLYPNLSDGTYWIDPNGGAKSDAYEAFCDMTMDGGGWTLLAWTGNSAQQPFGVPYPGNADCPDMTCLRGTLGSRPQLMVLTAGASAYVKTSRAQTMASFDALDEYDAVGKYDYGDLSTITPVWGPGNCDTNGSVEGVFRSLKNADSVDGTPVFLAPAYRYQNYDYNTDSGTYLWNVGTPNRGCDGSGSFPGSWMGTWSPSQYGPASQGLQGAHSAWLR